MHAVASSPHMAPGAFFKSWVHYFSMQVVMNNKYFLLNPEKKLVQIRFVVFEKSAKAQL